MPCVKLHTGTRWQRNTGQEFWRKWINLWKREQWKSGMKMLIDYENKHITSIKIISSPKLKKWQLLYANTNKNRKIKTMKWVLQMVRKEIWHIELLATPSCDNTRIAWGTPGRFGAKKWEMSDTRSSYWGRVFIITKSIKWNLSGKYSRNSFMKQRRLNCANPPRRQLKNRNMLNYISPITSKHRRSWELTERLTWLKLGINAAFCNKDTRNW